MASTANALSRRDQAELAGWRFGNAGPRFGGDFFGRRGSEVFHGTWDELFARIDELEAKRPPSSMFDRSDAEAAGWTVRPRISGGTWVGFKPGRRLPEHIDFRADEAPEQIVYGKTELDVIKDIEVIERTKDPVG